MLLIVAVVGVMVLARQISSVSPKQEADAQQQPETEEVAV